MFVRFIHIVACIWSLFVVICYGMLHWVSCYSPAWVIWRGGVVMNILMHSFGRYVYTPWTGMAICKYSSQVQSAIFCIPPIQLMILRGILRLEQNFRKIYLAVVSLMAQSGGFKLCFVSTALGICRVPLGAATEQREGRLELVVILWAPHSQPPSSRAGVLLSV